MSQIRVSGNAGRRLRDREDDAVEGSDAVTVAKLGLENVFPHSRKRNQKLYRRLMPGVWAVKVGMAT